MISVIIPCYKQAHYLMDCIASLQAQTYPDWEAIIVNDGSPDNTAAVASVLRGNDSRIRYVEKENGGLSSARNAGVSVAGGEFIQFLDADDKLQPDKLKLHAQYLLNNSHVDLVFGNARYFKDDNPKKLSFGMYALHDQHDWIKANWDEFGNTSFKFFKKNLFPVCSPLLRRDLLRKVGDFDCSMPALEDWDLWWRCDLNQVKFSYLEGDNSHALIRMHYSSMTNNTERIKVAYFRLRLKHLISLPVGNVRSYHLDELLTVYVNLYKLQEILPLTKLLQSTDSFIEKIYIWTVFRLKIPWFGQKIFTSAFKSLPWRARNFVFKRFRMRILLSI